jgi:hypothetical protein
MRTNRRRVGAAVAFSVGALGLIGAVVLGSGILALVGSLGLLTSLVALERYPRPRDR